MSAKTFKDYLSEKLLSEFFGYKFSIESETVELNEKASPEFSANTTAIKTNKSSADAKGKLLELLVGAHANNGVKNGQVTKHAEDTRSKGKKASDIHDALVHSMFGKDGTNHPGYKRLMNGAKELHKKWEEKNLKPGEKVVTSHWSSQPGDIEKITGQKDPDSKADVIHVIKDAKGNTRYAPVSLKIGQSDPNMANNGSKTLAHHSGSNETDLTDEWNAHTKNMAQHYGEKSSSSQRQAMGKMDEKMAKEGIDSIRKYHKELSSDKNPSSSDKARLEAATNILNAHDKAKTQKEKDKVINDSISRHNSATESSNQARANIATKLAASFNAGKPNDSHARIHNALVNMASPRTVHKQSIAIAHENKDGSIDPHVFDSEELIRNHLDNYHGLHAESSGISVNYYGINKTTGKREKVATHGMKQGNGPHAGWNSTLTMPGIIKKSVEREDAAKAGAETTKAISKAKATSAKPKEVIAPVAPQKTSKPVAKPIAKPKQTPAVKSTPIKTKIINDLKKKNQSTANSPYDYKGARSQDLGRKTSAGDTEAEKELQRRQAKKKVA